MPYLPTPEKMRAVGARPKWGETTWTFGGFPERLLEIGKQDITLTIGEVGCSCGANLDNPVDYILPNERFFDELLVALGIVAVADKKPVRNRDWVDEHHFKVGERVFFDYPHDDFPRGPVTIITLPEWVRWYSNVHVRSDDGQDYELAHYEELKPLEHSNQ